MTPFGLGNLFLVCSILATSTSQVILKGVMGDIPTALPLPGLLRTVLTTPKLGPTVLALGLIGAGFLCWLLSIQRLPLSYAYSLACGSALVVALMSWIVLGEVVTWRIWVGALLIALGSALVVSSAWAPTTS